MIIENKQLTENFFEELLPKYAKIGGNDFPKSGYYKDGMKFTEAESDEKVKQKFNHILKSIVMKRFGQYYDENEIEQNFEVLLRNTTTSRAYWCWCGIQPGTEAQRNYIPEPDNTHFDMWFEISIEPKSEMGTNINTMEKFDQFVV